MKRIAFMLVAVAALAGGLAYMVPASEQADGEAAPIFVDKIPSGYRDWRFISVSHEGGNLNGLTPITILGNDLAIKAYREESFRSRTAQSLPLCISVTPRRRRNNKVFGRFPIFRCRIPPRTFSLWSRTQRNQ